MIFPLDIHYYDVINIHHPGTEVYLHSHELRYPLRYEDGRISSQGRIAAQKTFNLVLKHFKQVNR